jgi:nucleoside-diphosphate-sugar epimerase
MAEVRDTPHRHPIAGRKVLVTGASGFLGSHLCERLLKNGAYVHGVSRSQRESEAENMRWWRSSLDDVDEVRRVVRAVAPDVVFHLAGHVTAAPDMENVMPTFSSLLASTVHLLLAATELGCRRIVLIGSVDESTADDTASSSPYATAKFCGSVYGRMFRDLYDAPVVITRTFMTYGPRQRESKIIPYVVSSLLRGESPRLSNGLRVGDWIYVDDVIDGMMDVATIPNAPDEVVDLGTGNLTSVRQVVAKIVDLLQPCAEPEFGALADRPDEPGAAADVERSWSLLGWRASTPLETGLERTIAWHRRQAELQKQS